MISLAGIVQRVIENGDLHDIIPSGDRFAGMLAHFPYRIAEELNGVSYANSPPSRIVILAQHADDGIEGVAFPFVLRDDVTTDERFTDQRTAYFEILERFVILRNRQEVELMLQLRPAHIISELLHGLEVFLPLDRSLDLPNNFIPRFIGLDRELKGGVVTDEGGVQQVFVIAQERLVQMPSSFRSADGFIFPFRPMDDILVVIVEEEE